MKGLPAELALFPEDRQRTKGIAAVQRDRVIENMENTQAHRLLPVTKPEHPEKRGARRCLPSVVMEYFIGQDKDR